jgi:RNA polymerase sigma-70 factor (ECF subfamily)
LPRVSDDEEVDEEMAQIDMSPAETMDSESRDWIRGLRANGTERVRALERLHDLLLRAARSEAHRRSISIEGVELEDLCHQAADDALVAITRKLDTFHGRSRFTTWVYKFAILEISVKLRRHVWRGRTIPTGDDDAVWERLHDDWTSMNSEVEMEQLVAASRLAVAEELTPKQRDVFVSVVLNDVPIDVLSERMQATRGAIYKVVHDARRKLRRRLERDGFIESGEER